MASVRFIHKNDISQKKNWKPESLKLKRTLIVFKILSIIQYLIILYMIYKD